MKPQIDLFEAALFPPPVRPPLAVWLSVLLLLAAVAVWRVTAAGGHIKSVLAGAQPSAAETQAEADPLAGLKAEAAAAESLARRLKQRQGSTWEPLVVSSRLFGALPESIWLSELSVDARGRATVEGVALDVADIERFGSALGQIAALSGTPLRVLESTVAGSDEEATPPGATRFKLALGSAPAEEVQEVR